MGCSSLPGESAFRSVALGDQKGDVLYKLGNPNRTYQKEDTQRWVYKFEKQEKEIWFKNGIVVYTDKVDSPGNTQKIEFTPVQ